jgi:hypothetical protein
MARAVGKRWGSMGLPSLGLPSKAEDMVRITSVITFRIRGTIAVEFKNPIEKNCAILDFGICHMPIIVDFESFIPWH